MCVESEDLSMIATVVLRLTTGIGTTRESSDSKRLVEVRSRNTRHASSCGLYMLALARVSTCMYPPQIRSGYNSGSPQPKRLSAAGQHIIRGLEPHGEGVWGRGNVGTPSTKVKTLLTLIHRTWLASVE